LIFSGSICKFWLVGIEMREKTKELNLLD